MTGVLVERESTLPYRNAAKVEEGAAAEPYLQFTSGRMLG